MIAMPLTALANTNITSNSDGVPVVGYVYQAQPATIGQGVHEGMFLCRFLTSDIETVLKRKFYGLDPLFGQVVGYLRDTGLQEIKSCKKG